MKEYQISRDDIKNTQTTYGYGQRERETWENMKKAI